ncbi:HIT-like domain-containing protein [Pelagophyceae sp. CCMP2097]|nr:HIT-like domain-containing protein [Pelagophyceae sp. CCMP2097]
MRVLSRTGMLAQSAAAAAFGGLALDPSQVEVLSARTMTLRRVNPLTPGHVVVAPLRPASRLADLDDDEHAEVFQAVLEAQQRAATGAAPPTAFNVAVKDGAAAGQPVEHVHVHVVPRRAGDLQPDEIYGLLDAWTPTGAPNAALELLEVPSDADRMPRTPEAMSLEADSLRADSDWPVVGPVLFGRFVLDVSQVFFSSELSYGIVNLKPLVPGHVMVVPRRAVPRLSDLTTAEARCLWRSARLVQEIVLRRYAATGVNVAMQDGADAGQSVPHVHIHILPRGKRD